MKMFEKLLTTQRRQLKKQINLLENSIQNRSAELSSINTHIEESNAKLEEILNKMQEYQTELGHMEGIIEMQDLRLEYTFPNNTLDELEQKESEISDKIVNLIVEGKDVNITRKYTIDDSVAKGNKFQNTYCKNLIMSFNTYFEKKKKTATIANYGKARLLIIKKYDSLNKKGDILGVSISKEYLDCCLEMLKAHIDTKQAKSEEKNRIKEERKRMREQEKLLAEAEKERKKLEAEKKSMELAYGKSLSEEERNEIKEQLANIDKRLSDIDYRVNNPKAGWLYIIHSPSLKDMVKIGVTRRLSGPYERVRELSGSSLPEPFQIDGYCFSDDAFALESDMHKYFDKERVNPNKEFFYVSPSEAINVLKNQFKCDVHFVDEEMEDDE